MIDGLNSEGKGTPSGKSADNWLQFEFKEYYLKEMNLQIFRDFEQAPTALAALRFILRWRE